MLTTKISPLDFNIRSVAERVKEKGDVWKGILDHGIDLSESIERLESLFHRSERLK